MFAPIDNSPINLLTNELYGELGKLSLEVAAAHKVKIIVFESADLNYFIAHYDVSLLLKYPDKAPPKPT